MGGWVDVLQVFQVHPDLRLGILQLHVGGAGGGQAQGSNQAFNSFKISYQVGYFSSMKYALQISVVWNVSIPSTALHAIL